MKIVSLKAENVKRLSAVEIHPDGSLVIIGGKNKQGKTSVLDCIQMALGGKGSVPPEPIRKGAKKGEIVTDLGELVVTRSFTKKGTYLSITTADGQSPKSPQAILDALVGTLSFDPLQFSRLDAKKQAEVLRELVGLDFSDIESRRAEAYESRTEANRDLKRLKAQVEGMEHYPEAPKEPVDVEEVNEEYRTAKAANEVYREKQDVLEDREQYLREAREEVARLEEEMAHAKEHAANMACALETAKEEFSAAEEVDEQEFLEKLTSAGEVNRQVEANARRKAAVKEAREASKKADELTAAIEKCDEEKAQMLEDAKMPVAGLGLDETGVTFNELPFEQCSGAEQLQISVAVGLALNPKLPVILIRDGSLLDEDSLRMLAEMAEKAEAQVWLEAVSTDKDKCQVIIEDGMVKEE